MEDFSIFILIIGVLSFGVGVLMLLSCIFMKDCSKTVKIALWAILLGTLMAISGFTLCSANFHLDTK